MMMREKLVTSSQPKTKNQKMTQIVKTKQKRRGRRPSNLNPARRSSLSPPPPSSSPVGRRRSSRRRNVLYEFDIDDYVDDDEFYNDEEVKLERLVNNKKKARFLMLEDEDGDDGDAHAPSSESEEDGGGFGSTRRGAHAPSSSEDGGDGGFGSCRRGVHAPSSSFSDKDDFRSSRRGAHAPSLSSEDDGGELGSTRRGAHAPPLSSSDDDGHFELNRGGVHVPAFSSEDDDGGGFGSSRRGGHVPTVSSDDDDDDAYCKPSKKRKVNGGNKIEEIITWRKLEEVGEDDERGGGGGGGGSDYECGTESDLSKGVSMPDKRTLELILDTLQKKDVYGVYAEPVDPDELPDYHDVIKHPMDFGTMRKKLAKGLYLSLKEFESDVFLICANAMQYNAPDTIYYKQASSIQEQAKLKFQRLRASLTEYKAEEKYLPSFSQPKKMEEKASPCFSQPKKAEEKASPCFSQPKKAEEKASPCFSQPKKIEEKASPSFSQPKKAEEKAPPSFSQPKKQSKKSVARIAHDTDPVGSETLSGGTTGTGKFSNGSSAQTPVRPNSDQVEIAEHSLLCDNILDEGQELPPGKGITSKLERTPSIHDEKRRETYNMSFEPVADSDSVLSTFEGESKQLIPVGLHVDHSYTRSLARFAATLGPVVWKIASQTIAQAIPEGVKFGPGWVGEYEPLPTPVLMPENRSFKDANFLAHFKIASDVIDNKRTSQSQNIHLDVKQVNDGYNPEINVKQEFIKEACKYPSPRAPVFSGSKFGRQNSHTRNSTRPENKGLPRAELNHPSAIHSSSADFVTKTAISAAHDIPSKPVLRKVNHAMASSKHQNSNNDGFAPGRPSTPVGLDCNRLVPMENNAALPRAGLNHPSPTYVSPAADDFVKKRPSSVASDITSKPVQGNGNLASLASFKHPNSNNDGFIPGRPSKPVGLENNMALPRVELNHPSPTYVSSAADFVAKRPTIIASDIPSKPNGNLASMASFMHPNSNNDEFPSGRPNKPVGMDCNRMFSVENNMSLPRVEINHPSQPNGNLASFKHPNRNNDGFSPGRPNKPVGMDYNRMVPMEHSTTPRRDTQGPSHPIQTVAEKTQHQPNGFGFGSKQDNMNNAASAAAPSWMSLGGTTTATKGFINSHLPENTNPYKQHMPVQSVYNPAYHQPQATRFHGDFNTYQQPVRTVNDVQNQSTFAGFPQMVTSANLSPFQAQSGWRGVTPLMQQQSRPKQESRPPDLNIGYQSMGSPVRQSTNMMVDTQQPDLALQL